MEKALFYSLPHGHCVALKPTFIDLSKNVKSANFLAVDMSTPNESMKSKMSSWKFKVEGYPTVVSFYNGQPYSIYKGDRTAKDLTTYISKIGSNWNVSN
jgi:thiol-disulfide isomerase/thioredoxin